MNDSFENRSCLLLCCVLPKGSLSQWPFPSTASNSHLCSLKYLNCSFFCPWPIGSTHSLEPTCRMFYCSTGQWKAGMSTSSLHCYMAPNFIRLKCDCVIVAVKGCLLILVFSSPSCTYLYFNCHTFNHKMMINLCAPSVIKLAQN